MKHTSKILSLILSAAFLISLASCASGSSADTTASAAADETTTAAVTTEPRIEPNIPEGTDFEGYEFKVLTKGTTNIHWKSKDIAAEEQNGDPINDAVFERNMKVGEKYNFTVSDIPMKNYGDWTGTISSVVLSGEHTYDMFAFDVGASIVNGYLYNLYDVPTLDLTQPYYDRTIIENLTIGDKLFSATGDMLIMDNDATLCVQFNKKLEADFGVAKALGEASLYDVVNKGAWTLDALHSSAKLVASDLNGNGEVDYVGDLWGFQTEYSNYLTMLNGAGETLIKLDSDGYPVIAVDNDRAATVIDKIYAIQNDATSVICADIVASNFTDVWGECMDVNFTEGRALFSMAGLVRVTHFRAMDIDFGVIPVPKYDEAQEGYHSNVSVYTSNFIALPSTTVNADRAGMIIEALSCESMYTLTPAYYDITLNGKAVRDEESSEMIDLILDTMVIDLGSYFKWGNLVTAIRNSSTFASTLEAGRSTTEKAIDTTMEYILG